MDAALRYYNCYTDLTKALRVSYNISVATADGNVNGSVRFGKNRSNMQVATAMHEVAHTLGIGGPDFGPMLVNGRFPGAVATAELRAITGIADDEVHGDTQHFWPFGLNYESEYKTESDLINHCRLVVAIRKDMGYD